MGILGYIELQARGEWGRGGRDGDGTEEKKRGPSRWATSMAIDGGRPGLGLGLGLGFRRLGAEVEEA